MGFWGRIFGRKAETPVIPISALDPFSNRIYETYAGDKYPTSFGDTVLYDIDYWTLRERSKQLFYENKYAKGILRRLVTNEINTGLMVKSTPEETIIGVPEDSLVEWSEDVERRFRLWGANPDLVDYTGRSTWSMIQQAARLESLIAGDVLIVIRQDNVTKLPNIQLISGERVQTPASTQQIKRGHRIEHGVELDRNGRHVAYWHCSDPDPITGDVVEKRIPAFVDGNRRNAWLVYGSEKMLDEVRGQPLLSVILQSLKEIDRYKDATLRKATVNSILAMFIKKTEEKPSTWGMSGSASRKRSATVTDDDGSQRTFRIAEQIPGAVIETLNVGEEPVPHSTKGTDENFGVFESAVLSSISWSLELPPEILTLAFSSNYSASQAALNEYKIYLNKVRKYLGDAFYQPFYIEWLISSVLTGKIKAQGLIDSWRDPSKYDVFGAWVSAQWNGAIKPSTDLFKLVKGYQLMIEIGAMTRSQAAQELSGSSYILNSKQLKRENEQLAKAMEPLLKIQQQFDGGNNQSVDDAVAALGSSIESIEDQLSTIEGKN